MALVPQGETPHTADLIALQNPHALAVWSARCSVDIKGDRVARINLARRLIPRVAALQAFQVGKCTLCTGTVCTRARSGKHTQQRCNEYGFPRVLQHHSP